MSTTKESGKLKVKIVSVPNIPYKKIGTIEGDRKVENQCITVKVSTAAQMCDGKNWKMADEKQNQLLDAWRKYLERQKELADMDDDEEDAVDDEDETDGSEQLEDLEKETSVIGDDATKELIKKLPSMKFEELKETAIDSGIEEEKIKTMKNTKANKAKLVQIIIRKLRG